MNTDSIPQSPPPQSPAPTEEELEHLEGYANAGCQTSDYATLHLIAAYRDAQIESVAQARRYIDLEAELVALREALDRGRTPL